MESRELKSLQDLQPAPYNPRQIDVKSLTGLKVSLEKFGDISGIVWNSRTGNLVAGHQRFKALQEKYGDQLRIHHEDVDGGVEHWLVTDDMRDRFRIRVVDWPLDMEMAANVAANAPTIEGSFTDGLGEILDSIREYDADIFDAIHMDELRDLMPNGKLDGRTDPDAAPDPVGTPVVKVGDLWSCGSHRLLCGDTTELKDLERLMGGEVARMIFTDPPYGVNYDGGTKVRRKLAGDSEPLLYEPACRMAARFSDDKAALYLWHAGIKGIAARAAMAAMDAGYQIRCEIVWVKNMAQFGALSAQYKQKHEPLYYCFRKGKAPRWFGPKNETTVWNCDRASANKFHPTQKPVALAERAMGNSSRKGDMVLDPFLGSGTTMVAAERTGRRCYGMEIDPRYVQVALQRWAEFTGEDPERHDGAKLSELVAQEAGP